MAEYTDLEISLYQWSDQGYNIELRFNPALSDTTSRFTAGPSSFVHLDLTQLKAREHDNLEYGTYLINALLSDPQINSQFNEVRASHESSETDLRVRMYLGPTAAKLAEIRWEVLGDPRNVRHHLFTNSRILFSRFLTARDSRPIRPKPRDRLRCLTVVANPNNLSKYQPAGRSLAPINVEREVAVARNAFQDMQLTVLDSRGRATLDTLIGELQLADLDEDQAYDILYLVCHGAHVSNRTKLYLENESGDVEVITGDDLVIRFTELKHQPRLVVLAACQSAISNGQVATGDQGALSGLGPRLAEVGVPAVIAMQHDITMTTAVRFFTSFFSCLMESGEVDRAMAAARSSVQDRFDWWVPVLYMRLRTGRIWYLRGLGIGRPAFARWAALLGHIENQKCTPILGSGLVDPIVGSTRQIARRWAETHRFPMSVEEREDLPQVAQYLAVTEAQMFPRDELRSYLLRELLRRFPSQFPEGLNAISLTDALNQVGQYVAAANTSEPHLLLAQLGLPLYVLAKPDELMTGALRRLGRKPHVEVFEWREESQPTATSPPVNDRPVFNAAAATLESRDYPTQAEPLVYHLFGKLGDPNSIVLTEDDYFDYLIGVTSRRATIPPVVRRALTDSSLLFLGFRIDEWSFRVLFRSLLSQLGAARRDKYAHVAVQIDPAESRIVEPELARQYLEGYFGSFLKLNIYWGSLEEFLVDLRKQWKTRYGKELGS